MLEKTHSKYPADSHPAHTSAAGHHSQVGRQSMTLVRQSDTL